MHLSKKHFLLLLVLWLLSIAISTYSIVEIRARVDGLPDGDELYEALEQQYSGTDMSTNSVENFTRIHRLDQESKKNSYMFTHYYALVVLCISLIQIIFLLAIFLQAKRIK